MQLSDGWPIDIEVLSYDVLHCCRRHGGSLPLSFDGWMLAAVDFPPFLTTYTNSYVE